MTKILGCVYTSNKPGFYGDAAHHQLFIYFLSLNQEICFNFIGLKFYYLFQDMPYHMPLRE